MIQVIGRVFRKPSIVKGKKLFFGLSIVLVFVLTVACRNQMDSTNAGHFMLAGTTNQIPDGTILYLTETLSNQVVDSMQVIKNKFQAEGHMAVSPTNYYLHTKDFSEYASLWIEAGHMTFDASATDFENAIITGSKTQSEVDHYFPRNTSDLSDEEVERMAIEFIQKHPDNRLSVSMLAGYSPNWGAVKVKQLYDPFSQANKESEYGRRVWQYITLSKDYQIGDSYTDFEMKNPKEELIKVSDHLGKVTLLEFWASWCGPCRQRNPELRQIYKKYHPQGFEIIGISLDFSKKDWEKAIVKDSLTWLQVSDLKGRNSLAGIMYGVNAIPDNFLLDSNGLVIGKYVWGEELERAIEKGMTIK